MAIVKNPEERFWRTDFKRGRGIYVLISNDVSKPSEYDPLVGVGESQDLADHIVEIHNAVIRMYGRHYRRALEIDG